MHYLTGYLSVFQYHVYSDIKNHDVQKNDCLAVANIRNCLVRLGHADNLGNTDCHTTTKIVSKALCNVEIGSCEEGSLETLLGDFNVNHKPDQKTVYRVDLPEVGHSFAIARCGNKGIILQSWSNDYSIGDWLDGKKAEIEKNAWLPTKGVADISAIAKCLANLSQSIKNGNLAAHDQAIELFNPLGIHINAMVQRTNVVKTKWQLECTAS